MYNYKFLIVNDEHLVNILLNEGWEVVSVTAQHISVAGVRESFSKEATGNFAVVLKKEK